MRSHKLFSSTPFIFVRRLCTLLSKPKVINNVWRRFFRFVMDMHKAINALGDKSHTVAALCRLKRCDNENMFVHVALHKTLWSGPYCSDLHLPSQIFAYT